MISANECNALRHPTSVYSVEISCSKANDSICYSIQRTATGNLDTVISQIDFGSLSSFKYLDVQNTDYILTSIAPVNDEEVICTGFAYPTSYHYTFFRYNFSGDNFTWEVQANSLGKQSLADIFFHHSD